MSATHMLKSIGPKPAPTLKMFWLVPNQITDWIDLSKTITHRLRLEEVNKGFETLETKQDNPIL